jgi:trans-2,3-dihydro-3-hydroxyanthranilate isomerase
VVLGLGVGPTAMDLQWDGERLQFVWMTQRPPEFGPVVPEREAVAAAIGLAARDLLPGFPVQRVSCGNPFLLVPLRDAATVDRALSDAGAFRRLRERPGLDLPIFLFAFTPPAAVHSRMFAPEFGIVEDPATGSASGPLGCYLLEHGLVRDEAAQRIISMQGVAMGRPSRLHIAVDGAPGAIASVRVGGRAVLVARGELLV